MDLIRKIPKVDKLLAEPACQSLLADHPRPVVLAVVRQVLDELRKSAVAGTLEESDLIPATVGARVEQSLAAGEAFNLRRVVNGTGVVIHTNLGRSSLAPRLREHLSDIAFGYSTLEYNLETGERGTRYAHVEKLICQLTGAEAALVVNNNAAAVLLVLSAIANGQEVIVSRGELVEIGGAFRIPEVMKQGGALLREVGTTNRTHLHDYRTAISEQTAMLLKVHCSNFAVVGFTAEVTVAELAALGKEHGIPVVADIGSGNLVDWSGVPGMTEPKVQDYLAAGIDLVTFSGDKLLGGPQAGIIAGSATVVNRLKKHQLLRALRVDKLTLAALEGTLRLYRDERLALAEIPTLRLLRLSAKELKKSGQRIVRQLRKKLPATLEIELLPGISQVGGGALPLAELPTWLLAIRSGEFSARELEEGLRKQPVPVIGRISRGDFILDLRTINDSDWEDVITGFRAVTG
ncbi:MAG: L-seryl-tRNA(Sec) selenium transferase [Desulfuromonadaceae bacterium]|nr:L-seryl-tRNA(Sec) selenium transferase [Desulfuromonadaceae bacterium]MDD2855368.1 L-seryl-tRNA(Sec) selenium transferase [Desulfuromonadaceae bacterium]